MCQMCVWWGRSQLGWRLGIRRRGTMKARLLTLFTVLLITLLTVRLLLKDMGKTPYPSHGKREKRTGYAPRHMTGPHPTPCLLYLDDPVNNPDNTTKPVPKVLLLTYLKAGGSHLLSQLFDKSENITFWSEPIDGILSDLYGTLSDWHPLDVFTNQEGLPRHIPACEEEAIVHHLSSLYSCRLGDLPTEVLTKPEAIVPTRRARTYLPCLQKVLTNISRHYSPPKPMPVNAAQVCKELTAAVCPKGPYTRRSLQCYKYMQRLKTEIRELFDEVSAMRGQGGPGWMDDDVHNVFKNYARCMASLQYYTGECLSKFTSVCDSSDMVVVKSTRLRGEHVARLMNKHQDLKVIHFVRDPRAIALSRERTRKLSEVSQQSTINEAVLLCQRMHYDIAHLNLLKHKYPHRILSVRFEDFMQNPESIGGNVFSFLQIQMPKKVKTWLELRVNELREIGLNGEVQLRNLSKVIYKWRKQITDKDNQFVVKKCADVLKSLKYSPLH